MAINVTSPKTKNSDGVNEIQLRIANGDLEALESIQKDYNVKNIEGIIAFAISVLKQAGGKPVAITTKNGSIQKFMPADGIRDDNKTI